MKNSTGGRINLLNNFPLSIYANSFIVEQRRALLLLMAVSRQAATGLTGWLSSEKKKQKAKRRWMWWLRWEQSRGYRGAIVGAIKYANGGALASSKAILEKHP